MVKRSFISGLIAGGSMVGIFLLTHMLFMKNFSPEMWTFAELLGYSSIIVALSAIFFGIKTYRDKILGGKISFGRAFTLGVGISAVASVIFGIYIYILYTVISPDLSGKLIEVYREKIKTSGQTQEIIAQQLVQFEAEARMWNNPVLQSFIMLVTVLMIGILISLVCAAILRRKEILPAA